MTSYFQLELTYKLLQETCNNFLTKFGFDYHNQEHFSQIVRFHDQLKNSYSLLQQKLQILNELDPLQKYYFEQKFLTLLSNQRQQILQLLLRFHPRILSDFKIFLANYYFAKDL